MNEKTNTQPKKAQSKRTITVKKFVCSVNNNDKDTIQKIGDVLEQANNKNYGGEVTFTEVALIGISKINEADIKKLKHNSVSKRELIDLHIKQMNKGGADSVTGDDLLYKTLKIKPEEVLNALE